jgi:hypothetical protein
MVFALQLALTVLPGRIEENHKSASNARIGYKGQVSGFLSTAYIYCLWAV